MSFTDMPANSHFSRYSPASTPPSTPNTPNTLSRPRLAASTHFLSTSSFSTIAAPLLSTKDANDTSSDGPSTTPQRHQAARSTRPDISPVRFWAIFASLCIVVFLFALDQLIVATAIEKITAEFNSLSKLPWIASGYFLTLLSFNLLYSQANSFFPSKHVMIFAIVLFEIGSVICAAAPSMAVLILGRCISGCGAAGVFGSGMLIITELTTLAERPRYFSGFGICFGVACIVGPVLGGFLADHLSWRWCFWINLPLGGVALICLMILQPAQPPLGLSSTYAGYSRSMFLQILKCDWLGVCISTSWGTCWILALQWAGITKDWTDPSVIVALAFSGLLPVWFCLYEWAVKDYGYFRIRLLTRRTIAGAGIVSFFMFGLYMSLVYYLSLSFQAVYHATATSSGLRLLPMILTEVFFLVASALVITYAGRSKPIICVGPIFLIIATSLFSTIEYGTSMRKIYAYQVVLGVGLGCCLQNIMIAVQHELRNEPELISLGTGLVVFLGFSGRIFSLSLASSIFENQIQNNLRSTIPDLTADTVILIMNDATSIWSDMIPEDMRAPILKQYSKTLSQVFLSTVPMAVLALAGALWMKNAEISSQDEQRENGSESGHVGRDKGQEQEAAPGSAETSLPSRLLVSHMFASQATMRSDQTLVGDEFGVGKSTEVTG